MLCPGFLLALRSTEGCHPTPGVPHSDVLLQFQWIVGLIISLKVAQLGYHPENRGIWHSDVLVVTCCTSSSLLSCRTGCTPQESFLILLIIFFSHCNALKFSPVIFTASLCLLSYFCNYSSSSSPLLLYWLRSSRVILECPKPLFSLTKLHNEELIPFLQCSSPEQIANWCRKCQGTISNWGKSLGQQNLCRHPTLGKLLTPTSWSPKCGKYHCIDCNSYRWRTPECGKWEEAGQTQVPPTLELR